MLDYMKKSFLTGVGLALRSKKEIEELAKEFAKKSEMDQEQAKQFFEELHAKYDDTKIKLDTKIEEQIKKVINKLDIPTHSEMKNLTDRIEKLAQAIEESKK
ncbi:MAG: phasin family protein [Desulfobacteraceae bacterium]|nr:phasin family protein [Desulfobacteraceae bacterium]